MGKNNSITVIALKNQIRKALKEPRKTKISCKGNLYVLVNGATGNATYVVKVKHGCKGY